jgi:site-specific recombinase XerD
MYTAGGFSALLRGFRLALTVEGLRPHTIHSYLRDVERFTESVDGRSPRSVSPSDIRAYIATLQDGRAPKTVREAQLALRRFFRFLVREGEIDRDPTTDMKLVRFRVEPQPTYSEPEVKGLLLTCDSRTLGGIRDKALILTLFDTGVREGELVSMGLPEWERRIVRVDGKTGVRDVPPGDGNPAGRGAVCAQMGDHRATSVARQERGAHGLRHPANRSPSVPPGGCHPQGRSRLP